VLLTSHVDYLGIDWGKVKRIHLVFPDHGSFVCDKSALMCFWVAKGAGVFEGFRHLITLDCKVKQAHFVHPLAGVVQAPDTSQPNLRGPL
jgi:hypothetical protein